MMGPFIYCMATQAHDQMSDEISPKLLSLDENEIQPWTFSHTDGTCTIQTFSK